MNTTYLIVAGVLVVVILGAMLWSMMARHKRSERLQGQFGSEYDHTVQALGNEQKAQVELEKRQKHVEAMNIRPLTVTEYTRYLADWVAVQSKFVDEPGQAVVDADRLIMEVMQLRAYPISDFEQRAADVSISYPTFEDLRKTLQQYRSFFNRLVV